MVVQLSCQILCYQIQIKPVLQFCTVFLIDGGKAQSKNVMRRTMSHNPKLKLKDCDITFGTLTDICLSLWLTKKYKDKTYKVLPF